MRTVWMFPGQLTEHVGMTGGLAGGTASLARALALASALVGEDVARIASQGPEALLRRDDIAASAVVAVGAASAEELIGRGLAPDATLGYSLGLYTAAATSGAISLEDALRIVIATARMGGGHFPAGTMAMGLVTGIKLARLESELSELLSNGEIAVTNINTPAQIVLAGRAGAIDAALDALRKDAMRCERLRISRPYHSRWMAPVAAEVADLVRSIEVSAPRIPLHDHRDGARLETADALRERLTSQLVTRLDWPASVRALIGAGMGLFVEMPPGSSTTRMVRWIERDAGVIALDEPEDRARYLAGAGAGVDVGAAGRSGERR